jgi:hypothetical protein
VSVDREQGFLSRWARLKREARLPEAQAPEPETILHDDDGRALSPDEARQKIETENRELAEAVDIESLDYSSDYTLFLKKGVTDALKRQALRKLWTSDPVLACVDGLNDYDEDYRTVTALADGFKSSWQVGKGFGWMDETLDEVLPETSAEEAVTAGNAGDGRATVEEVVAEDAAASDPGEAEDRAALPETGDAERDPQAELVTAEADARHEGAENAPSVVPRPSRRRVRFE